MLTGESDRAFEALPDVDKDGNSIPCRTQAANRRSEANNLHDEYVNLQQESCPCLHLASLKNRHVAAYYGRCSREHHRLLLIFKYSVNREEWIDGLREFTKEKSQGCRTLGKKVRQRRGYTLTRTLTGVCPHCNKTIRWQTLLSRFIAIMKLPPNQFWKGVVRSREDPNLPIFQGSARCNLHGHPNHCLNPDHINLETTRHNARRKRHHGGVTRCCCYKPCIGPEVRYCTDGGSIETKQVLVTWHWEDSIPEDLVPDDDQPVDEIQWEFWETTELGPKHSHTLPSPPRTDLYMVNPRWNGGDTDHLTLTVKPSPAS